MGVFLSPRKKEDNKLLFLFLKDQVYITVCMKWNILRINSWWQYSFYKMSVIFFWPWEITNFLSHSDQYFCFEVKDRESMRFCSFPRLKGLFWFPLHIRVWSRFRRIKGKDKIASAVFCWRQLIAVKEADISQRKQYQKRANRGVNIGLQIHPMIRNTIPKKNNIAPQLLCKETASADAVDFVTWKQSPVFLTVYRAAKKRGQINQHHNFCTFVYFSNSLW